MIRIMLLFILTVSATAFAAPKPCEITVNIGCSNPCEWDEGSYGFWVWKNVRGENRRDYFQRCDGENDSRFTTCHADGRINVLTFSKSQGLTRTFLTGADNVDCKTSSCKKEYLQVLASTNEKFNEMVSAGFCKPDPIRHLSPPGSK
jgi:hypothetical protein